MKSVIPSVARDPCWSRKDPSAVGLGMTGVLGLLLTASTALAANGIDVSRGKDTTVFGSCVPSLVVENKSAETIDFLQGLDRSQFEGAESRQITLKEGGRDMEFSGIRYLETWAKPNFYFHVTTAYAILRHNGIELGKPDFLAGGQ